MDGDWFALRRHPEDGQEDGQEDGHDCQEDGQEQAEDGQEAKYQEAPQRNGGPGLESDCFAKLNIGSLFYFAVRTATCPARLDGSGTLCWIYWQSDMRDAFGKAAACSTDLDGSLCWILCPGLQGRQAARIICALVCAKLARLVEVLDDAFTLEVRQELNVFVLNHPVLCAYGRGPCTHACDSRRLNNLFCHCFKSKFTHVGSSV